MRPDIGALAFVVPGPTWPVGPSRGTSGPPSGELLERPCAHLYGAGGLRRAQVRGHENVLKRLFVHAGAFNLGLWMRTLFGVGTPRSLQGRIVALGAMIAALWAFIEAALTPLWSQRPDHMPSDRPLFGLLVADSVA